MPELYSDDNGSRVIVRHTGPPGRGFPPGGTVNQILAKTSSSDFAATWVNPPSGTGAAVGPSVAVHDNFVAFDGPTGKLLKDSGRNEAFFASKTYADTKQAAVAGKGLSQQDFTTALKSKLDLLSPKGYRGTFISLSALQNFTYQPPAASGDYATVKVSATTMKIYFYDDLNNAWTPVIAAPASMTGAEIAAVLFDTTNNTWDQDDCNIFTDAQRAQLAAHEALISSLGLSGVVKAYGAINYFSLTGTTTTVTGVTDGTSNMYKVALTTTLSAAAVNVDNGGAPNGRIRYTGLPNNVFEATANLAIHTTNASSYVVAFAKNGAILPESRQVVAVNQNGHITTVSLAAVVPLLSNEYLEVYIGRTFGTGDPLCYSLGMMLVKIP